MACHVPDHEYGCGESVAATLQTLRHAHDEQAGQPHPALDGTAGAALCQQVGSRMNELW